MHPPGLLFQKIARIIPGRIYGQISPKALCQIQLVLAHIDGRYVHTHCFRILYGQMPQSADARNGHPLPCPGLGFLQAFVDCHPSAQDGRQADHICCCR
ncbi:hypothetical protein D3C86_1889620 [compost metagenome]